MSTPNLLNTIELNESVAQRVLEEARLPNDNAATAIEQSIGHWLLPSEFPHINIAKRLSKALFKEYPRWGVICTFDPSHLHTRGGVTTKGCWWVFECNPFIVPRNWQPVIPLILTRKNGIVFVDKLDGEVCNPDDVVDVVIDILRRKDSYNTAVRKRLGETISEIDRHNSQQVVNSDIQVEKFTEDFHREVTADLRPVAGTPKRPNPILDQFGNEIKK